MFDKHQSDAARAKPDGYVRVMSGPVRADDLLWSWTTREFLRADDPSWKGVVEDADQAVYVTRIGYSSPKRLVESKPAEVVLKPQPDLFK